MINRQISKQRFIFVLNSRNNWKEKCRDLQILLKKTKRQLKNLLEKIKAKEAENAENFQEKDSTDEQTELEKTTQTLLEYSLETEIKLNEAEEIINQQRIALEDAENQIKLLQESSLQNKKENIQLQTQLDAQKAAEEEKKNEEKPSNLSLSEQVRTLVVMLILIGNTSFRSIPRILNILTSCGVLAKGWIPSFGSGINWVLRIGIARLKNVVPIKEEWIAVTDTLIGIGTYKVVVILRVKLDVLQKRGAAAIKEDAEVIHCSVVQTCNGEIMNTVFEETFKKAGMPVYLIQDGGSDLNKGAEEYIKFNNLVASLWVVSDLGHVLANALKAEFSKLEAFMKLLSIITLGSQKLCQTAAAAFMPPKLRKKGRYMTIGKIAEWTTSTLGLMARPGAAAAGSILAILRNAFPELTSVKDITSRFNQASKAISEMQKILKNQGLNQKTFKLCMIILAELPNSSIVRQKTEEWLKNTLKIYSLMVANFTKSGKAPPKSLMVSSDIIESLFGSYKNILGRSSVSEINQLIFILPALCGNQKYDSFDTELKSVSHVEMQNFFEKNIPISIRKQKSRMLRVDVTQSIESNLVHNQVA